VQKRHRFRLAFPYLLIAAGALLAFQGARDLVESRLGQYDAAREFSDSAKHRVVQPAIYRPQAGDTVAKLSIPRLNTELYVVEGTDTADLRRGPGHLTGTAMPGEAGNCVIAGHRDTHFRVLKDIRVGDDIVLQTASGQYLYRVKRTHIVSPQNTSSLQPTPNAELNLITCYPFYYVGSAPKRFVVEAQLAGAIDRSS
jgi:sortase A